MTSVFGVTTRTPLGKFRIDDIARVTHEANRGWCLVNGDTSQPGWDDAPEWQRNSARNGVLHVLGSPHATPEDSHQSWMQQKADEGWTYGPEKLPDLKLHPCMVPYHDLPSDQRMKDVIFRAIVLSFMGRVE